MAQQTINIGTVANDSTGDPLRSAFSKVNANFTELYTRERNILLQFGSTGYNPADGATVYVGGKVTQTPRSFASQAGIVIPVGGIVTKWWMDTFVNAGGSGETVNFYLRHNDTVDFGNLTDTWDTTYTNVISGTLNQAVSAGDTITVKIIHPTWPTTNPTSVIICGWILIQY